MWSFDFADIEIQQRTGSCDDAALLMIDAAKRLERGGAEFLVIATNTMHIAAPQVQAGTSLPLLHIADPTAERIKAAGLGRVGLQGTAFTMEQTFYKGRLADLHGLGVLVPDAPDRALVHRIIYEELVKCEILDRSRQAYRAVIERLVARGAEAIILGCTEIMLLVGPGDSPVPCTTRQPCTPRRRSIARSCCRRTEVIRRASAHPRNSVASPSLRTAMRLRHSR
jgi:aspartate racemase